MAGSKRHKRRYRRRPDLSQHFIKSAAIARRLIAFADLRPADLVVEAGPGDGMLTRELANTGCKVVAIEADRCLYDRLRLQFANYSKVSIRSGDFLKHRLPSGSYRFFGNIPYSRTADIVRKLALAPNPPVDGFIVLETAAAKRFLGQPFGPESTLSLAINIRFATSILAWLGPSNFSPPPSVNSVLVRFRRHEPATLATTVAPAFDRFVREFFRNGNRVSQARLRKHIPRPQIRSLIEELGFPVNAAPSEVAFEHWKTLFQLSNRVR